MTSGCAVSRQFIHRLERRGLLLHGWDPFLAGRGLLFGEWASLPRKGISLTGGTFPSSEVRPSSASGPGIHTTRPRASHRPLVLLSTCFPARRIHTSCCIFIFSFVFFSCMYPFRRVLQLGVRCTCYLVCVARAQCTPGALYILSVEPGVSYRSFLEVSSLATTSTNIGVTKFSPSRTRRLRPRFVEKYQSYPTIANVWRRAIANGLLQ